MERHIPLDKIDAEDRLRLVNSDWVVTIADSIRARMAAGQPPLIQPITVRPVGERYALVVGMHRYGAVGLVGLDTIQAIVRDLSDLDARLEEIDENLVRQELTAFDRAVFLAERRAVYEGKYPEATRGKKGALARWNDATGNLPLAFTEDASRRIGLDVTAVRKILKTFDSLSPASRDRIKGTWLSHNDSQMKSLSKHGPERQAALLDVLLREVDPAQSVAEAVAIVDGQVVTPEPDWEIKFAALVRAWDRADSSTRVRFLKHAGLAYSEPKKAKGAA